MDNLLLKLYNNTFEQNIQLSIKIGELKAELRFIKGCEPKHGKLKTKVIALNANKY